MTEVLRPYQSQVIADFWRAVETGPFRIIIVAPTASGKTVIARTIIKEARKQASGSLFLAHRREIISQTSNKLRGIPHGIIRPGDEPRPLELVQVASIQTLHRRAIKGDRMALPEAKLVIVDEAHHVIARTYQEIINQYPDAILLGLTATPCRGDGRGLGNIFQTMLQCPQVGELVAQGHLVPTKVLPPSTPISTASISATATMSKASLPSGWTPRSWLATSLSTGFDWENAGEPLYSRPG